MSDRASLITSASNPLVARVRKLRTRKGRRDAQQTFVEGIAVVRQAFDSGMQIDSMIAAPELLRSDEAERVLSRATSEGIPTYDLERSLFARLSDRDKPTGLAAIVSTRASALEDLVVDATTIVVVLDKVASPGNLGTIARAADAAGARALVLAGDCADPWDPNAVKASMGTLFELPVCSRPTVADALKWLRSNGLRTVATSAHGSSDIDRVDLSPPVALVFGSERHGLDAGDIAAADVSVRIPMQGHASSLNLAVAAGICLYECVRQRRSSELA